jgi:hypothetical protein
MVRSYQELEAISTDRGRIEGLRAGNDLLNCAARVSGNPAVFIIVQEYYRYIAF